MSERSPDRRTEHGKRDVAQGERPSQPATGSKDTDAALLSKAALDRKIGGGQTQEVLAECDRLMRGYDWWPSR